jgi:phosphatidate cytidylyltransferase
MSKRIITGIILDAIVVLVLAYSHYNIGSVFFVILIDLIVAFGLYEFYGIVEKKGSTSLMAFGVAAGVLYCTMSFFTSGNPITLSLFPLGHPIHGMLGDIFDVTLVFIIISFFVFQLLRRDESSVIHNFGGTVAGMFYVAWLLAFAAKINYYPGINEMGMWYIILLVVIAKGGDSSAYFIGIKFGRHKLCPKISPKKTIEGAIAHIITGIGAAIFFKYALFTQMTLIQSLVTGISISIVAQFGDMAESLLKRDAQIKDSGGYFRELGGILDLIDSILFTLPLLYYLMRFWLV